MLTSSFYGSYISTQVSRLQTNEMVAIHTFIPLGPRARKVGEEIPCFGCIGPGSMY